MSHAHQSCSADSLAAGEALAGTAVHTARWLLLEVREPWGQKGLMDTPIPALARARVEKAAKATGARVQLIRQPHAQGRSTIRILGVRAEPGDRGIHTMELDTWTEVAQADLAGLVEGRTGMPSDRGVVLVCSHGRRDVCCARLGAPIYRALHTLAGDQAWQSSHLGGHRFAPTLVFLPQGLQYGRVELTEVDALWEAAQHGQIGALHRLRGATHLPREAQFAVHAWLQAQPGLTMDAIDVTTIERQPGGRTQIRAQVDGKSSCLDIWAETMPEPRMKSCADVAPCAWNSLCSAPAQDDPAPQ
jgi:hypothetical protein